MTPGIPTTMRAVVITAIGGPDVLEVVELPTPSPAANEVLIEVRTVAANRQDLFTMTGQANVRELRLPHTPGIDPAGVVAAVGDAVTNVAVGDRVVVKPAVACGRCEFCLAGEDDACARLENIGVHRPGGMAQYVVVPSSNVFHIPPNLGYGAATAIAHSFPVALHLLRARAQLRPDDVVLVTGAAGAIGSAAVQLAKLHGATVVAAVGGRDRAEIARQLGADLVVDYGARPAFSPEIRAAFPNGVSLYVEPAGNPAIWNEAVKAVGRRGRIAICGSHAGPRVELDLSWLFRNRVTIHGCSGSTIAAVGEVIELAAAGRIRPAIDSRQPLADVRSAFQRLLARENRGKVILDVSDDDGPTPHAC
jgi:acryloyl-coenzyme A reductase